VFQPSKEILAQNLQKFMSYGFRAGVYSASAGKKFLDKITFATIGSVTTKKHLFRDCQNIIVDECHLVNGNGGMYHDFIKAIPDAKVLGLTATPYRLTSGFDGAMLTFLNRSTPKIFNEVLYYIQNKVLFDAGHLSPLEYFKFDVIDRKMLTMNSGGTDFTDSSLRNYYRQINMPQITIQYANRLLVKRKNLLVFCSLIAEANEVAKGIPGAVVLTGDTEPAMRDRILLRFKSGKIRCVINVGVLTTGFDYPELETILMARSTMSLALYYQIFGRGMRPHPNKKSCWLVDLGGNINFFGKIETMEIKVSEHGLYAVWNNGRQLTNVSFTKN
jgi:DNA repair protein RadD